MTLRGLGARVTEGEFIVIAPTADAHALADAAAMWCRGDYDWLAVTSRNALSALAVAAGSAGGDLSAPMPPARLAVVGKATARAAAELGLEVALRPARQQSAAGLVAEFPDGPGRVLAPLGNLAGDVLERGLARKGWDVDAVEAYRTIDGPGLDDAAVTAVRNGEVDAVVLTSGSMARRFATQCGQVPARVAIVAIGATTASVAREAGLNVATVAGTPDYEGVVMALRRAMEGDGA
nr:uroporphyrinogen-III synthase [Demequina sp. TTPB684]